jgi:formylglycine-generating enzyme required for sulfatase activity
MRRLLLGILFPLILTMLTLPATAGGRVALVIGNSDYKFAEKLGNPANDAKLIADTLQGIGFTLVGGGPALDLDKPAFDKLVREFAAQTRNAEVAVFYYAGHGLQVNGENYLVPVDANPLGEATLDIQTVTARQVLEQMTGAKLSVVILDACRNNPFRSRAMAVARGRDSDLGKVRALGAGSEGLAPMNAPAGTLIAYATAPDAFAQDGLNNSPYAKVLAEVIRKPGLDILRTFNEVSRKVVEATAGKQQPWMHASAIDGDFVFVAAGATAAAVPTQTATQTAARPPATANSSGDIARAFEDKQRLAVLEDHPKTNDRPADAGGQVTVGLLSPAQERALKAADHFKECEDCPEMVTIGGGTVAVGSPGSEPGHDASEAPAQDVVFSNNFAVGRSAVTFAEWDACVAEGGCNAYRPGDYGWGRGKRPVINVSWNDVQAYIKWLSQKTGAAYRLLSEAEREYVARGCAQPCASAPYWFGTDISPDRANYDWRFSYAGSRKAQPPRRTVAADASAANPFGLLQVHGNVREWVQDCWNATLAGLPKDGSPRTSGDCDSHVLRGGSWADEPKDLRSAKRSWEVSSERRAEIGFRVARTLRN